MSDLYEIVGLTIEQVAACVEALLGMDADHAVVRRVRQSLETSPAPVEGVVPGSNLERQIQLARQTIERWPDDVRRAMGIVAQETPAAPEKCKCNYPDAWHCARGEHMKACVCGCHAPNRGVL